MLGKISRGASFLLLIFNLRFQHGAHQIVDFVLSNPLIRPVQVPSELNRFAEIVASICPGKVLEIGTFQGGTLCILARLSAPRATIISIDLPGGKFGGGQSKVRSLLYHTFRKSFQSMHLTGGDVPRFWNEVKRSHPHEEIIENREQGWGIGVLYV